MPLILAGPTGGEEHQARGHPERPERLGAVMKGIGSIDLGSELQQLTPAVADIEHLTRVHAQVYLDQLRDLSAGGGGWLDADTYVGAQSWDAALRAAGAGLSAVEALKSSGRGVAFVAARPPGHHALTQRGMGFCLLNNVAVAAAALADDGERVAIIDWDVHHGNGTQAIFWDDPRVLYASTHQFPWYPGTGEAEEVGGPNALGTTVNVPLPAGATGDVVRRAFDDVVGPTVTRFAPTWVLISAGYDAHRADPMAGLQLSSGDFAALAHTVAQFAPQDGRLVFFLEGGYDLDALRSSVATSLAAVLGADVGSEEPTAGGPGNDWVAQAAEIQMRNR